MGTSTLITGATTNGGTGPVTAAPVKVSTNGEVYTAPMPAAGIVQTAASVDSVSTMLIDAVPAGYRRTALVISVGVTGAYFFVNITGPVTAPGDGIFFAPAATFAFPAEMIPQGAVYAYSTAAGGRITALESLIKVQ